MRMKELERLKDRTSGNRHRHRPLRTARRLLLAVQPLGAGVSAASLYPFSYPSSYTSHVTHRSIEAPPWRTCPVHE